MKNFRRYASFAMCLLLCTVLLLLGAGCNEKTAALLRYNPPEELDKLETTCVAENTRYSLIWDAQKSRVILYDKVKNCEWSYVPQESLNATYDAEGYEVNNHPKVESPVIVNYYATSTLIDNETNAYAQSISKDSFTLRKIDNGVEMVCYFDKHAFAIPISFTLMDDGIEVSVDVDRIEENSEYCISGITLAPFFCSISNTNAGEDGYYMFMPSGSGTLIYPTYTEGSQGTSLSEPVYGEDANIEKEEQTTAIETVRIPVYGSVNGDRAVCAIIKDGAESAYLDATIGQELTGYSYISAEFRIRGYQEAVQELFTSSIVKTNLYADSFTSDKLTVGFYPLYDDDASYVGMAEKYREYLTKNGSLSDEKSDDTLLNLKFVGGIQTKKFIFGIPSSDMLLATTVKDVQNIVSELSEKAGSGGINANLIGFGSSGNDIGKVAGGYKINSAFGDGDDIRKLSSLCGDIGANLFVNFDMVRFRSSGGGVSSTFGKADAANGSYTAKYYYDAVFRTNSTIHSPYYLVTRGKLAEVAENIKESAEEWRLPGVSLDTLTSIVYSDYTDREYYAGANTDDQFGAIINSFKNDGYKVAGSDANGFAAALCSHVYDVPVQSSKYRVYSADVPFYEIVFKGRVSMSASSLNLATDKTETILKSAESGLGLTYTLIGKYDTNLVSSAQNVFYGSVYWDESIERGVRDDIIETVAEYQQYFESVNGAQIVGHEIINKNVRKTVFDNGVTVYVNYGYTDYNTEDGTVAARSYISVKEA